MQQHDRARVNARQKLGKRLLVGRLIVLVPIDVGQRPEYRSVAKLLRHFEIALAVNALRRAVIARHILAGRLSVERFKACQFLIEGGFV